MTRRLASIVAAIVVVACTTPPGVERASALPGVPQPADNPSTPQKVALGGQLFVDKRLSGSGQTACQSCHYRNLGWTDGTPLSRRDDGQLNSRHSPTLYNVGFQTAWYWDGRATTLEGQVLAAWRGQTGADPAKVSALLATIPGYASQFQAVFGGPPSPETVSKALASYFRSLISTDSPWDRYEAGAKGAVSADAIEGQAIFTGKGGCAACHAPPYYGNTTYWNIGLEAGKAKPDPGRFTVTKIEADTGAFKTPTLRSAAQRAPYFHDGSRATLREAVAYMASAGGDDPKKTPLMANKNLSEAEVTKLIAFLESLTSTEPWSAPVLP